MRMRDVGPYNDGGETLKWVRLGKPREIQNRLLAPIARNYRTTLRRRSALPTTDTELKLMAALATMGFSSRPKAG